MERLYLAVAKIEGGYAVRYQHTPGGDLHVVGNCRDFETFEEANEVAKSIASGDYQDIAPSGVYVCNR